MCFQLEKSIFIYLLEEKIWKLKRETKREYSTKKCKQSLVKFSCTLLLLPLVCLHTGYYVNEPNFSLLYITVIITHSEGLMLQDKR